MCYSIWARARRAQRPPILFVRFGESNENVYGSDSAAGFVVAGYHRSRFVGGNDVAGFQSRSRVNYFGKKKSLWALYGPSETAAIPRKTRAPDTSPADAVHAIRNSVVDSIESAACCSSARRIEIRGTDLKTRYPYAAFPISCAVGGVKSVKGSGLTRIVRKLKLIFTSMCVCVIPRQDFYGARGRVVRQRGGWCLNVIQLIFCFTCRKPNYELRKTRYSVTRFAKLLITSKNVKTRITK